MFFPYATDAPIYHWPITTVALIVVNCLAFVAELNATDVQQLAPYVLGFGQGLEPIQWITSLFLHAGWLHLIGNMIFLWTFGIIVEGKLGWWKMLGVYLGIGAAESAIDQMVMLGASTPSFALGASGAIFGLMAMCLVWAPENSIECILIVMLRPIVFSIRVVAFVGLFLAIQVAGVIFGEARMSSELLHLIGAAVGFPVGIALLRSKIVDCEHWDIFSVWAGRHTMSDEEREATDAQAVSPDNRDDASRHRQRDAALQQIRQILRAGQPLFALHAHDRMTRILPDWTLPQPDLCALILALHKKSLWLESIAVMNEYLSRYEEKADLMRLKLAQVLVEYLKRPEQATKVFGTIRESALDDQGREYLATLRTRADQLRRQIARTTARS
jgi:membrane associated rhomboid family serine protease